MPTAVPVGQQSQTWLVATASGSQGTDGLGQCGSSLGRCGTGGHVSLPFFKRWNRVSPATPTPTMVCAALSSAETEGRLPAGPGAAAFSSLSSAPSLTPRASPGGSVRGKRMKLRAVSQLRAEGTAQRSEA